MNAAKRINELDSLRFLAVTMVMIAHWFQWKFESSFLLSFQFVRGVTVFFVLSGFLITKGLLANKNTSLSIYQQLKQFYIKRTLRIFPIYYLLIFICLVLNYGNLSSFIVWITTFTTNIYMSFYDISLGNFGHFWSLAVEEQFYLFWPLAILLINNKRHLVFTFTLIVVSMALKVFFFYYLHRWEANSYFTFTCMNSLLLGALVSYKSIRESSKWQKILLNNYLILFSALVYSFVAVYYTKTTNFFLKEVFDDFLFSVFIALLLNKIVHNDLGLFYKKLLSNKLTVYLGKISYGIYLYHTFVPDIYLFFSHKIHLTIDNKYLQFLFFYLVSVLIASISWYFIELPISEFRKRKLNEKLE